MVIDVSPEVERDLLAQARKRGVTVGDYLRELLAREATGAEPANGAERATAFLAWADAFPDTPAIANDALCRAVLYPDRW